MIGVVLWSDMQDRKAVVWCEDQGDLALLTEPGEFGLQAGFWEIGDVLQFDVTLERSYRRASNARLVQEAAGMDAVRQLHTLSQASPQSAEIIPFRLGGATNSRPAAPTRAGSEA